VGELPFDLPDLPRKLRDLIAQVPAGRVTTCGALAEALGNPIAARWVGYFLLHHHHSDSCLCHRVVRGGGGLGSYLAGDTKAKAQRLQEEGVVIRGDTVELAACRFEQFSSDRPLEKLKQVQERLVGQVSLRPRHRIPALVGGVDVSYGNEDYGVAAYVLVETASNQLVWSKTIRRQILFPYITTYLAFREVPILLELLAEVREAERLAPMLLVDGSGVLHQRHAGIAAHLGVVAAIPTVGVTKKLLCGQVDLRNIGLEESRPVMHEEHLVGVALRTSPRSRRPIFISPGHRVDLAFAERLVRRLLSGHRLPEPLYWADRLSRAAT
jgi:deoxyribonuclease V